MIEPQTAKLLLNSISKIEKNLQSKESFLTSSKLQDNVLSGLQELSEIGRSITWGYRGMLIKDAWRQIDNLVFR